MKTKLTPCVLSRDQKGEEAVGLYIHIPFCKEKCLYCDFLCYARQERRIPGYMESLLAEIDLYVLKAPITCDSIFIGGGTPSHIDPVYIEAIINKVSQVFNVSKNCEVTIEANPSTLSEESLGGYRSSGVNRLSLGVQTTENTLLEALGRTHSYEEVEEDVALIRKMGFSNLSLDLISGLPGQTVEDLERDIERVLSLKPDHLSWYSLIVEENTYFHRLLNEGKLDIGDEDEDRDLFHKAREALEEAGYSRYEISNFAKPGYESKHNLKYWEVTPYIGFGLGSHSNYGSRRYSNHRRFGAYQKAIAEGLLPIEGHQWISDEEEGMEVLLMGLRLTKGISYREFEKRFGKSLDEVYGKVITKHLRNGLLVRNDDRLYFTTEGMDLSNLFFREIL